jgi:CubicO group peptidase (beta-lactamase class C family)
MIMKYQLVILIVALLASCKSPNENSDNEIPLEVKQLEASIDSLFYNQIGETDPGAGLLIAYDGEMLIGKGYGLRDLENKKPVTLNTNFRMASVSKQFTDLCILSLIDQKLLALDDTLNKFWPYPVFKNITVDHLINHTSGIADYEEAFMEEWDRSKIVENKDILEWLSTNPKPLFPPGEGWEYSNTAYLVLALLVEKVSEQEFSAYAKENVFDQAGMKNTTYYNLAKPTDIKERAFCYEKDSLGNWKKVDGFFMNGIMGDGAVYTSIADYFAYDNALRGQSILSKTAHNLIFSKSSTLPREWPGPNTFVDRFPFLGKGNVKYSMGWFFTEDLAMHTGGWYGTRTVVVRERNRPLTIAILRNSDSSFDELIIKTYDLVDHYLKHITNN